MKRELFLFLAGFVLVSAGCLKDPDFEQLSSNFVVTTNTDKATNFSGFQTYYISDSIAYINNSLTDTIIRDANTQKLVDAIKQNMSQRGYTFVPKGARPDLGINMALIKDVDVGVIYSGWWDGYPGWWDPWYWGWYYPYYYPWSVTYVVESGSIVIDMIDLKNVLQSSSLKVVWGAVLGGAVSTDLNTNVQRGVNAINTAFAQSPSVKRN